MAASSGGGPLIFIIAGEPSGDALGAKLMRALRQATGGAVRFAGVGGDRMTAEGLTSLFPLHDIAVMGLTEVLPQLPRIFRRLSETVAAIREQRPDVLVTIDAPAFVLRVIRRTRSRDLPVVHYVAPQLWAWRPGRVKKLVGRIDRLMLLLPFEQEFFDRAGVPSIYVGHPVLEEAEAPRQQAFRERHGIAPDAPFVVVLPGSRRGLVGRMLPVYGEAMRALHARHPGLRIVVPVVSGTTALVEAAVRDWPAAPIIVADLTEKRAALAEADAALTTSGTATLELAVAGLPMVVTYKISALSAWLARRLIQVPNVAMPNLIAGRRIVPELLQGNCTPETIVAALDALLRSSDARAAQKAALAEVCNKLGRDGPRPSERAAAVVLSMVR
ncbi:MAG TPA: lipid-A-disaccharide synthase [Alphaproteobacteria bacterium]|nr:lipid-A-disaccharide synthase [Alphaproteobacteria bacterium]